MGFIDNIRRLLHIHYLIATGNSGSAEDIGRRVGVCRRTVLYYIEILRDLGGEIVFDSHRKSYVYITPFHLTIDRF